ncbi:MAG: hypothetical protein JO060_07775, partial [Candidatus Eremiobacteraeota bacterium]|nr:hypothetical protein [Candidatus Eremiobacteraeota bacterium]
MVGRLLLLVGALVLAVAGALAENAQQDLSIPTVPSGYLLMVVAHVPAARELVATPNGDVIVGTESNDVYIVPQAESSPHDAHVFVHLNDSYAAGLALADGELFVGTQFGIWRLPYASGDQRARVTPVEIAHVRPSGISRNHHTTSVAVADGRLYAGIGSSCDACDPDLDATRATVQELAPDGKAMHSKAIRIRNPIALAENPATRSVWAGVAGQDELPHGHPYEIFDPVSLHGGTVDYGWPVCYDDHRAVAAPHDCSSQTLPRVVFPAYATPIGVAFYRSDQKGRFAFSAPYSGGAFVTLHGS